MGGKLVGSYHTTTLSDLLSCRLPMLNFPFSSFRYGMTRMTCRRRILTLISLLVTFHTSSAKGGESAIWNKKERVFHHPQRNENPPKRQLWTVNKVIYYWLVLCRSPKRKKPPWWWELKIFSVSGREPSCNLTILLFQQLFSNYRLLVCGGLREEGRKKNICSLWELFHLSCGFL